MENFENTDEINPQLHESTAITCLSHTGQNFVQRTTFEVLPSRKQVCRLSLKEQAIVVARGKPAKIVSKKQQVQFIQNNFFTNKPKVM